MNFKPTGKNVVIKLKTPTRQTSSGIILQEEVGNKNVMTGEVVDKGPQASDSIVSGSIAYVSKYAVGDVKPQDGDFVIVDEADIMLLTREA